MYMEQVVKVEGLPDFINHTVPSQVGHSRAGKGSPAPADAGT